MKLGTETGSVMNHIFSGSNTQPEVGMGASILAWTDRYAATIVKVTRCQIHVRRVAAKMVNGDCQTELCDYEYEENPNAPVMIFRKTKRGWKCNGYGLLIGVRDEYRDPSF